MVVLHPTDFSSCAEQARAVAVRLARALGAELLILHVAVEPPLFGEGLMSGQEVRRVFESQREWVSGALEERAAEARATGLPARAETITGVAHDGIVAVARREAAELIVMGTHGRGALGRFLVGSVADRVVRLAPCPVVTVRDNGAGGA
jgi:nucleotide-binding universal stress UspA family protein